MIEPRYEAFSRNQLVENDQNRLRSHADFIDFEQSLLVREGDLDR